MTAFLAASVAVLAIAAVGGAADGFVDPSTSQTVVAAGTTRAVPETLHLDGFPAAPADVVLAFDTTTSMDPFLDAAKADAKAIVSGLDGLPVRFAVAQVRDYTSFGAPDGINPYDLIRAFGNTDLSVGAAIDGLTTADGGFGYDEAYFDLFHEVAGYNTWGNGSQRYLVVLGDSTGHDGSQSSFTEACPANPDVSTDPAGGLVPTTDELVSSGVTLDFLTYPGEAAQFDSAGCHAAMARKTGGIQAASGNGKQIAADIASRLADTRQVYPTLGVTTVSTVGDADPSQWISFQKVPESVAVPSAGADVPFEAVVSPPANAPAGTYTVNIVVGDGESVLASQQLEFTVGIPLTDAVLTVDQASVPAGIKDVPLASIPPDRLALTAGSSTSSTPIGSTPIASTPIASTPIASTPIASTPIASTPIASTGLLEAPIASTGVDSSPLQHVLLSQINLTGSSWDAILCLDLKGKPLNALTLADVAANSCSKTNFEALRLGQVDLSNTLFKGIRWASLLWGKVTFAEMPGGLATWQARITNAGGDGTQIGANDTPLGADVAGILGSTAIGAAPIASTPIASTPIASTPIASTHVTSSRLGSVRVADMAPAGNIVNCNAVDCSPGSSATLGSAYPSAILPTATFGSLALKPALDAAGITVNDIVVSLLAASDFPWEHLPVQGLQAVAGTGQNATYHLKVGVDCSAISSFHAAVELPRGFFPVAGTSTLSFGGGANVPTGDPTLTQVEGPTLNEYNWDVNCPDGAEGTTDAVLSFQAYAGLTLGPDQTSNATVSVDDFVLHADDEAPIAVTENWGSNDEAATAPVIAADHLLVGHIGLTGDQDFFRLPLTGLPRGTRISVYLSHIANGADFDLTVGKPMPQGFFSSPIASTPIASTPIEDNGVSIDNSGLAVPSEALQDIAVGSAPIASTPIASTSTTRGSADELSQFVTQGESGFATIGVTGYNGSRSNEPYVLRVKVTPPPTLPTNCPAPPFPGGSPSSIAAGKLPASVPSTTKSLFLVNKQRLTALYGATDVNTLLTALTTLAARPEVAGSVVFVDGDAAVRNAYAAWDANRCSPAAANDVVRSINDVVAGYRSTTALPSLHFLVLLGGDDAIPMARTPDPVTLSPEVNEANDLAFTTSGLTVGNPLYASAATDNILSDGAYGVLTSIPWLGRELLLSQLSVARLVESPADMTGQINRYLAQNGKINPTTGTVTGYDFLADGAAAVKANLAATSLDVPETIGGHPAIGSAWTNSDLKTGFLTSATPAGVGAVNGHYNHFEAEAGDGSLVNTGEATATLVDRVLFTMGCHGGLNVPDSGTVATTPNPYLDWPQLYASKQVAMYLANTGYGYGDDGTVALSERLMALFAKKLHSDGGSVGEQWVAALQQYFATAGAYDVYDEKVMEETTFYGLPFWHYQTAGTSTPPAPLTTTVDPATGSPAATVHFPAAGADVHTQFGLYRPNLPITSQEVTAAAGPARGLWINDLTTSDAAATAAIGYPTVDLAKHEPKPNLRSIFFPASPFTLERSIVFGKQRDFVNVSDQFRPDGVGPLSGTQRSVTDATFKVLYSFSSDTSPPLISQVNVTFNGSSAVVQARIVDDTRVAAAAALVHLAAVAHWLTVPLVRDPGDPTLYVSAPIAAASDPEAFVEATDGVSVSYSANKGLNFNAATASPPAGPQIRILSPAGPYEAGQAVTAAYTCTPNPASVVSCDGTVAVGAAVDTASPGLHRFVVTSTDADGHTTSLVRMYTVTFPFRGFFQPVANEPVVNKMNAGRAIPVKFSLGGNRGLDIFAPGYPASQQISCEAGAPTDIVATTVTAGQSTLSYDAGADQYNYVWKTDGSWANTCRILVLKTTDGAVHSARFQFK